MDQASNIHGAQRCTARYAHRSQLLPPPSMTSEVPVVIRSVDHGTWWWKTRALLCGPCQRRQDRSRYSEATIESKLDHVRAYRIPVPGPSGPSLQRSQRILLDIRLNRPENLIHALLWADNARPTAALATR